MKYAALAMLLAGTHATEDLFSPADFRRIWPQVLTGANGCDSHGDENSCDADAACAWCKSMAVASSCKSLADARALPPSIFACDKINSFESQNGVVTWKQCADQAGIFTFDAKDTTVSPADIKRGQTEAFDMKGSISKAVTFSGYNIEVLYNGHHLKTETKPGGSHAAGPWEFKMSEKIPIIAPGGHYSVIATSKGTITGQESNGDIVLGCIQGDWQ